MRVENCILVVEGWKRSCCVVEDVVVDEDLRCDCVLRSEGGRINEGEKGGIYTFLGYPMTPSSYTGSK